MGRYKAVLFDLFHTLVDVASAPGTRGRYTADILGVSRADWNRACFTDAHEICRPTEHLDVVRTLARRIDPAIDEARIRAAADERQMRFDHALRSVEPEVLDVLAELRAAGLRIGLISNASTGEVRAWPDSPLAPLFDAAVFSCECGLKKPAPDIYHHALERVRCAPQQALFVGDGGSREHEGARAVGIDNVLLTRHLDIADTDKLAPRRAAAKWELGRLRELPGLIGLA